MAKIVKVTPSNPTAAASVSGVTAAVFGAPSGNNLVGTVHKQLANQSFDSAGTMTLDVDDVGALSAGTAVKVLAQNASHTLRGLLDCVVESTASSLTPTAGTASGTGQSVTFSFPAGSPASGDRMLVYVLLFQSSGGNRTCPTPTNLTLLYDSGFSYGGTTYTGRLYIFEEALTTTRTSYSSVTSSVAGQWLSAVVWTRGARTLAPQAHVSEFASAMVAPAITTSVDSSLLLRVACSRQWPRYFNPAGTELTDQRGASNLGMGICYSTAATAGTQPAATITATDTDGGAATGDDYIAVTIALDGTGGAPPPPPPSGTRFLFGCHQHGNGSTSFERKPGGAPFAYSVIRNHNAEYLQQGNSHVGWWIGHSGGLNQYNWSILDNWCDYHNGKGRRLLLNFFGNPSFIRRIDDQDAWGWTGTCSYVAQADRPKYRQFVVDTLQHLRARYGTSFVVAVECWNEPTGGQGDSGRDADNSQFLQARDYKSPAGSTYADGTAIFKCYADICKDIYTATKSVDTALPVLVGAHAWWGGHVAAMLGATTSDDGTNICEYADAFSFHAYGFSDQAGWPSGSAISGSGRSLSTLTSDIIELIPTGHKHKKLWCTEAAMPELWDVGNASSVEWIDWYDNESKATLAQRQYNWVGEFKAAGWQALITYSADGGYNASTGAWAGGDHSSGYTFMGDPWANAEVAAAWTSANTNFHNWG